MSLAARRLPAAELCHNVTNGNTQMCVFVDACSWLCVVRGGGLCDMNAHARFCALLRKRGVCSVLWGCVCLRVFVLFFFFFCARTPGSVFCSWRALWAFRADSRAQYVRNAHPVGEKEADKEEEKNERMMLEEVNWVRNLLFSLFFSLLY